MEKVFKGIHHLDVVAFCIYVKSSLQAKDKLVQAKECLCENREPVHFQFAAGVPDEVMYQVLSHFDLRELVVLTEKGTAVWANPKEGTVVLNTAICGLDWHEDKIKNIHRRISGWEHMVYARKIDHQDKNNLFGVMRYLKAMPEFEAMPFLIFDTRNWIMNWSYFLDIENVICFAVVNMKEKCFVWYENGILIVHARSTDAVHLLPNGKLLWE